MMSPDFLNLKEKKNHVVHQVHILFCGGFVSQITYLLYTLWNKFETRSTSNFQFVLWHHVLSQLLTEYSWWLQQTLLREGGLAGTRHTSVSSDMTSSGLRLSRQQFFPLIHSCNEINQANSKSREFNPWIWQLWCGPQLMREIWQDRVCVCCFTVGLTCSDSFHWENWGAAWNCPCTHPVAGRNLHTLMVEHVPRHMLCHHLRDLSQLIKVLAVIERALKRISLNGSSSRRSSTTLCRHTFE